MTIRPDRIVLTIFTPTYNRAHLLPRLFESIASQVVPGDPVEWLVIDDGSTDGTATILTELKAIRPDLVRVVRVENGGKHRAINQSAKLALGQWVMIQDSDDVVAPSSLEDIRREIARVEIDKSIGMIRALSEFPEKPGRESFQLQENPSTYTEWVNGQRQFDCVEIVRRSVLQLYPFPDNPGESFMAEGWLWYHIDCSYLTWFVNRIWAICFYQPDGLSASSLRNRSSSPLNALDVYSAALQSRLSLLLRIRSSTNWWRYWFHVRNRYEQHLLPASRPSVVLAPLGWLFFRLDLAII